MTGRTGAVAAVLVTMLLIAAAPLLAKNPKKPKGGGGNSSAAHSCHHGGWRSLVGYAGLLVGAWPLLATVLGEFYPGPFTSTRWMMTALSLGVWFLALAIVLPLANGSRGVSPEPGDGSEAKLEPSALRGN